MCQSSTLMNGKGVMCNSTDLNKYHIHICMHCTGKKKEYISLKFIVNKIITIVLSSNVYNMCNVL